MTRAAATAQRCQGLNLLAPSDGWFAKGFDMLDVKEAKTLLDELADWRSLPNSNNRTSALLIGEKVRCFLRCKMNAIGPSRHVALKRLSVACGGIADVTALLPGGPGRK
jgi:hypothetical protein